MELIQADRPPDLGQALPGIIHEPAYGCSGAPQLGVTQQVFVATVPLFDLVLAGEGATVQLEVELSDPCSRVFMLGLRPREEGGRRLDG